MRKTRRNFLKTATKTSIVAGGLVLAGCSGNKKKIKQSQNQKVEILYNGNTPYWKEYYANAK